MSKLKKPRSKRIVRNEVTEDERRKRAEERMNRLFFENTESTRPFEDTEEGVESCKKRVAEGKLCYCKEICQCRECQETYKELGKPLCTFQDLKREGGCAFGCNKCSECNPCY